MLRTNRGSRRKRSGRIDDAAKTSGEFAELLGLQQKSLKKLGLPKL